MDLEKIPGQQQNKKPSQKRRLLFYSNFSHHALGKLYNRWRLKNPKSSAEILLCRPIITHNLALVLSVFVTVFPPLLHFLFIENQSIVS